MNVGNAVRERILELCRERGITVNKLATMSGITQSTLNNIIGGRNRSTTVSTVKKVCDGLDITIQDFFDSDLFRGTGAGAEIAPEHGGVRSDPESTYIPMQVRRSACIQRQAQLF